MGKRTTNDGAARLTRIKRRTVADDVYDQIRKAILNRSFDPGERLNIPAIAKRFDVSQMPVRQAISRLAQAGLVEIKPRSGTFVAKVEAREVIETFDLRRALECLAAETAATEATDAELDDIERLVNDMVRSMEGEPDPARHDRLNTEFHRRIVALSRNEKLIDMYEQLNAHIKIARIHRRGTGWAQRVALEMKEHRQILLALRNRHAGRLAQALSNHIERAKNVLAADVGEDMTDSRKPLHKTA